MRSWKPSVTRARASWELEVMSAALMTRVDLPTRPSEPLDELLLAVDVLSTLGLQDLALDGRDRGALLALDVLLGLDQQAQVREHPVVRLEDDAQLVLARAVHAGSLRASTGTPA